MRVFFKLLSAVAPLRACVQYEVPDMAGDPPSAYLRKQKSEVRRSLKA
jgi:hypothetical protein